MADFMQRVMNAARQYTVIDFGSLKIALLAAGVLLGVYCYQFFSAHITWVWAIFLLFWFWILYRTFIKYIK